MFQFTHPGRGATQIDITIRPRRRVSIHAPREGCDCISICKVFLYLGFNSRTPGGVRQKVFVPYVNYYEVFQFTHPGRGATRRRIPPLLRASGFNSRTPGGVRQPRSSHWRRQRRFQFTHPGRGATLFVRCEDSSGRLFQFTHPGRGATL